MYPPSPEPQITVILEPENQEFPLKRPKTVLQLLSRLGIRLGSALVIREGTLLTHDLPIQAGEPIRIRKVTSSG